jgi:hypothetical protein
VTRAPKGKDDSGQSDAELDAERANHNAESFARTEETHAADQTLRGGGPNPSRLSRDFPEAASREDQEKNAAEAALASARNMTGNADGVSSVLPVVGGTTNMAMTDTERAANLDDAAVDSRGRLVGTYLDDIQAEEMRRRREHIEGKAALDGDDAELRAAAAARVRNLARTDPVSGADVGKGHDEQALVNTKKITGADQDDANDPKRRASATAGRDRSAGTDNI